MTHTFFCKDILYPSSAVLFLDASIGFSFSLSHTFATTRILYMGACVASILSAIHHECICVSVCMCPLPDKVNDPVMAVQIAWMMEVPQLYRQCYDKTLQLQPDTTRYPDPSLIAVGYDAVGGLIQTSSVFKETRVYARIYIFFHVMG